MTSKLFHLEIITPRRVVYNNEVQTVFLPGTKGNFQVLIGHAPMISALTIGEIRVREEDGYMLTFAAGGGFVEVSRHQVLVFAETCEKATEIDIERAKQANERILRSMVDRANYDPEQMLLALQRSVNRIRIATKYAEEHEREKPEPGSSRSR